MPPMPSGADNPVSKGLGARSRISIDPAGRLYRRMGPIHRAITVFPLFLGPPGYGSIVPPASFSLCFTLRLSHLTCPQKPGSPPGFFSMGTGLFVEPGYQGGRNEPERSKSTVFFERSIFVWDNAPGELVVARLAGLAYVKGSVSSAIPI